VVEIVVADISASSGRRAVVRTVGQKLLRRAKSKRASHVVLVGGRFPPVAIYTKRDLVDEVVSSIVDGVRAGGAVGDIVILPFATGEMLRTKLIAALRASELRSAQAEGRA
jgi:hypothetical protein